MFVAFLYLTNFTVHIDLVLAQRPNYISAVPVLEKGLTQPVIILQLACLCFFKLITVIFGGAKPRMQQWCPCKIVSGGQCDANTILL